MATDRPEGLMWKNAILDTCQMCLWPYVFHYICVFPRPAAGTRKTWGTSWEGFSPPLGGDHIGIPPHLPFRVLRGTLVCLGVAIRIYDVSKSANTIVRDNV